MIDAQTSASPAALVAVNVLWVGLVVAGIVFMIRRQRRIDNTLDPAYQHAPVAPAVVVERKFQYRKVNERRLYRITYRVHLAHGGHFIGWEDKYLTRFSGAPAFAVGTNHQVAYMPGSIEVRALPRKR
ncbi:hypothetical protein SAMN04488554_2395 [Ruania alba]|uniref:DUF2500 family protein n=2 Tax=Ruania alba TaxID=648782 RepID=A0A1H5KR15_9MICO|nr:hypothetical protein SAMN04488554_2395 [Ruania alba]